MVFTHSFIWSASYFPTSSCSLHPAKLPVIFKRKCVSVYSWRYAVPQYLHQGFGHTCHVGNKRCYKWGTVAAGFRVLRKYSVKHLVERENFAFHRWNWVFLRFLGNSSSEKFLKRQICAVAHGSCWSMTGGLRERTARQWRGGMRQGWSKSGDGNWDLGTRAWLEGTAASGL